jgi:hypothetical protein
VKIIACAIAVAALTGCASLPPAAEAYLAQAMATPLHYSVDHDKSEIVWGRAHAFVHRYTPARLIWGTRYVLQTYNPNPTSYSGAFAFYAARTPGRHKDRFAFVCKPRLALYMWTRLTRSDREIAKYTADRNSHIFSYYATTGIAPPERSHVWPSL